MKSHGYSVPEIAAHFGCCAKTVYNYLNKYREVYLEELEAMKSIDIVVQNLVQIDDIADLCLKLAKQIAEEQHLDPLTGQITDKKGSYRDKAEMLRLVRDFMKMRIDLLSNVGIIPKQADRIYSILSDQRKTADAVIEDLPSRPELERKALEVFTKQNWL